MHNSLDVHRTLAACRGVTLVRLSCRGGLNDDATSTKAMLLLAASASISWVFAKSIQNASLVRCSGGVP